MLSSLTLPLLCGAGLLLNTWEQLSTWHLLDPAFWGAEQLFAVTVKVSSRVQRDGVSFRPSVWHGGCTELCHSQSWLLPPYVHPISLPAPPSHFQQPSWVTVSPRWRKDVSHLCKTFFLNNQHSWGCEKHRRGRLLLCVDMYWCVCKRSIIRYTLYLGDTIISWFVRGERAENIDLISSWF